jgi:hypothetical protein
MFGKLSEVVKRGMQRVKGIGASKKKVQASARRWAIDEYTRGFKAGEYGGEPQREVLGRLYRQRLRDLSDFSKAMKPKY